MIYVEIKNNQLWYPSSNHSRFDVISHEFSYGGKEGLLEIYDGEEADGHMLAEEVFDFIYHDYIESNARD